ncbi:MAG: RHS repeat-associated core domain-containing protein [Planctomycetota bacterium]
MIRLPGATTDRLANTKEPDHGIGFNNHGFRYYGPEVGCDFTRDPIGYADGLNVYLSVYNNPVNHVDPLGLVAHQNSLHRRLRGVGAVGGGIPGRQYIPLPQII